MKAFLERIESPIIKAFSFELDEFEFNWHYHPEYELTLITQGHGMRMIGDHYTHFFTHDLVLLGPNIPHTWISELVKEKKVSATVIQFSERLIKNFKEWEEFQPIIQLLHKSSQGIYFPINDSDFVIKEMNEIVYQTDVEKIISVLALLNKLSSKENYHLASSYYSPKMNIENESRINKVVNHIQKHFHQKIILEQAAELSGLTISAFCKFFKKTTGRTFSDYVNDYRIGKACILLIETDKTIQQIALETGYENATYFNRVFLKKKECTPKQFRQNQNFY